MAHIHGEGSAPGLPAGADRGQTVSRVETPRKEDIQLWLTEQVAERLLLDIREIDVREPLSDYGLDSLHAIGILADLEDWLGREVPLDLIDEDSSIEALARHLSGNVRCGD